MAIFKGAGVAIVTPFHEDGSINYEKFAELVAARDVRLQRNVSENRLKNKPSKRDTAASNRRLITDDAQHRMESYDGEVPFENYIRIDNTDLSPEDAARRIKAHFNL